MLAIGLCFATAARAFVHPGMISTLADLDVAKNNQTVEPWKSALAALKACPSASLTYAMQGPFTAVWRGSGTTTGWAEMGNDGNAAYVQAVLWYITGNTTYATNAKNIVNAWSHTLVSLNGTDVKLLAGGHAPQWAFAGEILRYTNSGWSSSDITSCENMLKNIFQPVIADYAVSDGANFSTDAILANMSIAVFTNNQALFDEAYGKFTDPSGCPNDFSVVRNIAYNGQNVESGRDQVHSWSSYEALAATAEIAYHQGKDSFSVGTNRLLTGAEYWCKYNLGNTVPYDTSIYRCRSGWGPWATISSTNRGVPTQQGATCRLMYRAYWRKGLTAQEPYTLQMANAMGNTLCPPNARNGWTQPFITDSLLFQIPPATSFPAAGTYSLQNRGNSKMLDSLGRTTNGADCGMWDPSTSPNQNWNLTYVSSNVVKLQAVGGGLYLDGMGRTTDGATCGLWASSTSTNQQWTIVDAGGGYFKLKNVATGKCVDVGGSPWANGDSMEQWFDNTSPNQQWLFVAP